MSRVYWDSNLFIYLLEGSGESAERVATLRTRMLERGDELLTSALTLGEILVKPIQMGNQELSTRYRQTLPRVATIIDFSQAAAVHFAAARARGGVRPPDAIQLACAASAGVDLFVTNDERLTRLVVPGIQFIVSLDRAFL